MSLSGSRSAPVAGVRLLRRRARRNRSRKWTSRQCNLHRKPWRANYEIPVPFCGFAFRIFIVGPIRSAAGMFGCDIVPSAAKLIRGWLTRRLDSILFAKLVERGTAKQTTLFADSVRARATHTFPRTQTRLDDFRQAGPQHARFNQPFSGYLHVPSKFVGVVAFVQLSVRRSEVDFTGADVPRRCRRSRFRPGTPGFWCRGWSGRTLPGVRQR